MLSLCPPDLPGDPLSWGFEDVQKYLADAGFREVAAQLREEVCVYMYVCIGCVCVLCVHRMGLGVFVD